jgi:GntR family transcriptional regulator / MocR family aminotransferase
MTLPFDFKADEGPTNVPVYRRLSQTITAAIEDGRLESGAALPPSRELARLLSVSRDTILRCYEELAALNIITTNATRGTFVSAPRSPKVSKEYDFTITLDANRLSSRGRYFLRETRKGPICIDYAELNFCASPADLLPSRKWREVTQKLSQPENFEMLAKPQDWLGCNELREALSAYLNRSRGLGCSPADVAIFSAPLNVMNVICDLLLDAGDTIAIENPCYAGIREIAQCHSLNIFPVSLDKEGLMVSSLQQCEEKIKLVYCTPSHQDPTGITMSLARRKELLAWAKRNNAWILEDDFDNWFHYGSAPPPSLKALDDDERVIYVSNFWQILYPLTTVAYCLPPAALMPLVKEAKKHSEAFAEPIAQLTMATFLNDCYIDRHLRKTRTIFADRRRNLIFALKSTLGDQVQINTCSSGMNLLITIKHCASESVEEAARLAGLHLTVTTSAYLEKPRPNEYLISFALLESEQSMIRCKIFANSIKQTSEFPAPTAQPALVVSPGSGHHSVPHSMPNSAAQALPTPVPTQRTSSTPLFFAMG